MLSDAWLCDAWFSPRWLCVVLLSDVMLCDVLSCHVMFCNVVLCTVVSCDVESCDLLLRAVEVHFVARKVDSSIFDKSTHIMFICRDLLLQRKQTKLQVQIGNRILVNSMNHAGRNVKRTCSGNGASGRR